MTNRTDWMPGRFGLMVHWIPPGPSPETGPYWHDLNAAVNRFDVPRFLKDFAATGADWLIFTIGQNTGYYAAPNSLLDKWAGPGHCSERDLIVDIASGVQKCGKRFIAYLPCEVAGNPTVQKAFHWNTEEGTTQKAFQERYTQFVREWSERWGNLVSGWWFDGCYLWKIFHNSHMSWSLWDAACRAGNPETVIAYNDGSFCMGNTGIVTPAQDYLSGEVEVLRDGKIRLGRKTPAEFHLPTARFVDGTTCQWHALVPIDCVWAHGTPAEGVFAERFRPIPQEKIFSMESPAYSDDELTVFLQACLSVGGAVTLNVGIYQEGGLGEETVAQLRRIGARLKQDVWYRAENSGKQ